MKNLRWIVLSLLLSSAALIGLLAATFTPATRAYLGGEVGGVALLLAFALRAGSILCRVVRIGGVICRGLDYTVPLSSLAITQSLSFFAGSFTPPGQVGGEPVRIHRLSRAGLAVGGDAVTVVVVERVLDLTVFASLTFASFLAVRHLWGLPRRDRPLPGGGLPRPCPRSSARARRPDPSPVPREPGYRRRCRPGARPVRPEPALAPILSGLRRCGEARGADFP